MPKLPQISGERLVRLLISLGYEVVRQRGSHVRMQKTSQVGTHNITVPTHGVLAKGTLSDILKKIALWNNLSEDELIRRVK